MKILRHFTWESLKANRTRTLVTIIGIVLSMALFTAVLEGAYSGQQFLIRSIEESEGRWLLLESGLTEEEAATLQNTEGIGESSVWREVGIGNIHSDNSYRPYLRVVSVDANVENLLAIHLLSGRLPENENEILLPSHLASDGGVQMAVGDTLTIDLGKRVDQLGDPLPPEAGYDPESPESIVDAEEHTYTVVGIYRRLPYEVEGYGEPGYVALTFGDKGILRFAQNDKDSEDGAENAADSSGDCTVFLTLKNPTSLFQWEEAHPAVGNRTEHSDLRRFYGLFTSDNYNVYLYGFATILLLLIVVGSISLIYNSFSISVSARTQQFGILKSIGATNRQIRGSVLYEALLLAVIAIPIGLVVGCVGIGLTLYFLRDAFAVGLFMEGKTQMELVINPLILLAAAGICLLTTIISAAIPARRAIRISPIASIRQTQEVKTRRKKAGGGHLARKLFGFPGLLAVRNFQRSRSKYRSTVASLILSIVLFISASSFCAYITGSVEAVANTGNAETMVDITYSTLGYERPKPERVLTLLANAGSPDDGDLENARLVTKAAYYEADGREFTIPAECLTDEAREFYVGNMDGTYWGNIVFLQDEAFRRLCEANGLDAGEYFDTAAPRALVWNQVFLRTLTEGGMKSGTYPLLKEDKATSLSAEGMKTIKGYVPAGTESYDDGEVWALYYPLSKGGEIQWEQEPLRLPLAEAEVETTFEVGGYLREAAFGLPTDNLALVYPYSLEKAVLGEGADISQTYFVLQANDHARAFTAMKTALADAGLDVSRLYDDAASKESARLLVMAVNVFAYGFIILISLIAVANVFNTISTNVLLRRRELAMLRSIGLDSRGFRKMMNYECLIYGLKAILWGLPLAVVATFAMWRLFLRLTWGGFYIPWQSIVIAICSVFVVVFATMLYAGAKVRKLNVVDALKDENL